MNMLTPKRALISVSDKTSVADFARNLVDRGFELVSTGGTCKFLKDSGLAVTAVETLTGFPEILDGRVKTLHPIIHGGLLGDRRRADHLETMKQHNISGFSLLVLNLYPFAKTVDSGADFNSCIENIDIGGPAMLRASAKNHANVLSIISPDQFPEVLRALDTDTINTLRKPFAARAFGHTAEYDKMVNSWLSEENEVALRYGENPHQKAKLLKNAGTKLSCAAHANQLQGKELSYNNYLDADSAWELCQDLAGINAVIVKHNNPCGAAQGENLLQAFKAAKACDPVSAFGGVIALSAELDKATAEAINSMFVEVVLAPSISKEARAVFSKKPNVRLLLVPSGPRPNAPWSYRTLGGATLRQSFDYRTVNREDLRTTTKLTPSELQIDDLLFAFTVAKHTKSNAIILAKNGQTLGIGAGQMSRVDAARIAQWKARDAGLDTTGCVVASDAFFPFADGLEVAIESGASAVVQPGGSIRDNEVITAADKAGLAMVFTGIRHFRH